MSNISITESAYYVFLSTDRQLKDIEKFCCSMYDYVPLGIDTTYNLCDLWLTDTSYRNKRLLKESSGHSPVFFGPCMLHFKKNDEAFSRFAMEMRVGNPGLLNLKAVGVDMESAIFNGFKVHFEKLSRLICVRHLQQRDEIKIESLLAKTRQSAAEKKHSKQEILKDMYGERQGTYYEYGLAESFDEDDFKAKLLSLREKWEAFVPGFYDWFQKNRSVLFVENVIQSARENADINGLYYQNDVESQHAVQKCLQNYKKEDVATVIRNLQRLSDRQDAEEVRALYGAGNFSIAEPYKRFSIQSNVWHSWDDKRRRDHIEKFCNFVPGMTDSFSRPRNSGRKPSYQKRQRCIEPDVLIDRMENSSDLYEGSSPLSQQNESLRFPDPR